MIEGNEATNGTTTLEENAKPPLALSPRLKIDVAVLLVNATLDGIFRSQSLPGLGTDCSSEARVVAQERPYFPDAPSLDSILIPGLGHDLNAFRDARSAFQGANSWLQLTMPPA